VLHLFSLAIAATLMSHPSPVAAPAVPAAPAARDVASLLDAPHRRVRAMAPHLQAALAEGVRRSDTLAGLVWALEDSDVIVQIVGAWDRAASTPARTLLVPGNGEMRYVRIEISRQLAGHELIALIGHELFHAFEIALARGVRDEPALARHYQRIGFRVGPGHQFDTQAARMAERAIRHELGQRRPPRAGA
jgi:hypothetical protein